jgi:hypothetical protein
VVIDVMATSDAIVVGDNSGALTGVTAAAPTIAALTPAISSERVDTPLDAIRLIPGTSQVCWYLPEKIPEAT